MGAFGGAFGAAFNGGVAVSWATIRDEMQTAIDAISGLSVYDVMPDTIPNKNAAVVLPGSPLLEPSGHRNKYDVNIRVVVRASRASAKDAQAALDDYMWPTGAASIIAAVEAMPTLGGAVDHVQFLRIDNYGTVDSTVQSVFQADVMFRAKVSA